MEGTKLFKSEQINTMDILDAIYFLYEDIKGDVIYKTCNFLNTLKIQFNDILEFLKNPVNYPGDVRKIKLLIVKKFLNDAISEHYEEIKALNLHINFIERHIINTLFKGERYSGNPGRPSNLKSTKKTNNKEV